jgi:hypothetical protein
MRIPRYWSKGESVGSRGNDVSCWRWSDVSVEDAKREADTRAAELVRIFESGVQLKTAYGYDRPLREEIIEAVPGKTAPAIITRNAYGVLVLNTANAMFLDIDCSAPSPMRRIARRLLSPRGSPSAEEQRLGGIQQWASVHPNLGMRIYRTFAGFRCLITNQIFDLADDATIQLLAGSGSDPLYIRLCKTQGCFRARLTPKPWRCGVPRPPNRYPWTNPAEESHFRNWLTAYEQSIQRYCVCRFVRHLGPQEVHRDIQPILDLHDRRVCDDSGRPLA